MSLNGFIFLYRKMLDNPIVCRDSDHLAVWIYLLLKATHKSYDVFFEGKKITLVPGQLLTGRKVIAEKFNISESKVQRVLKNFKNEQLIEQQTTPRNRLISIHKWAEYQASEQQIEQQLNNNRTTTEQQLNTNNNVNKIKKVNKVNKEDINKKNLSSTDEAINPDEVIEYLNQKNGSNFRSTEAHKKHIVARINDGFGIEDFKKVIDLKHKQWKDSEMEKYLRPQTLFGSKFDSYLNEKEINQKSGNYFLERLKEMEGG